MKGFFRLSFFVTLWTYLVIYLGGLVRVCGAGLGCPDWPKCFGRWIPPTSVSQLPPEIDPGLFNFTLAWIEYINRLAGMILGLLIAAIAITAIVKFRRKPGILIPSILAGLLVAYQGWQGGQVVASELKPFLVSLHLGVAFIIASLMVLITTRAYYLAFPAEQETDKASKMKLWAAILWLITLVQVVLGTRIRGGIELVAEKFPLFSKTDWLAAVGALQYIHYFLGIVILILTFLLVYKILKTVSGGWTIRRQVTWGMIAAIALQIIIGTVLITSDLPQLMQLFHLWMAGLFAGLILILYISFGKGREV
jgi:cytochrome c oxidase assembly protein subunit 15